MIQLLFVNKTIHKSTVSPLLNNLYVSAKRWTLGIELVDPLTKFQAALKCNRPEWDILGHYDQDLCQYVLENECPMLRTSSKL